MKISVVIPAYNGSRFIGKTIQSVLNQEQRPDELIVCDDNSTDDTLEICRRYGQELKIYSNPEGPSGFVDAWNKAIARAKGDYISILHQDDLLDPAFVRMGMTALAAAPEVRHLFTTCRYIDEFGYRINGSYIPDLSAPAQLRLTGREYLKAYQRQGEPHIHRCPGVITHSSIFSECRYEPAAGHIADDDFFYRVGMYTDVIGILAPLASFRVHAASATGALDDERLAEQLMRDYWYQCRQWRRHPFLDREAYGYFVSKAYKYARRCLGYGVRKRDPGMIARGIDQYRRLLLLGWR